MARHRPASEAALAVLELLLLVVVAAVATIPAALRRAQVAMVVRESAL